MQKQNEGNKSATPNWTSLYEVMKLAGLNNSDLADVVKEVGIRNLVRVLNAKLNNPRFEVQFDFDRVEETIIEGEYEGLALFYHDLTIPKPVHVLATTKAIKETFDVLEIREDDLTITYEVYLGEGPYANTIDETLLNINCEFGPKIERRMESLKLADYQMLFNIGLSL